MRSAIGLGANIKVFDRQLYRLHRLQYAVGRRVYTSIIDSVSLGQALAEADVVIGALRGDKGMAPLVVSEEMVANMKPNSVIIDVAIDHGGVLRLQLLQIIKARFTKTWCYSLLRTQYCIPICSYSKYGFE